jgi:hypothetical protein
MTPYRIAPTSPTPTKAPRASLWRRLKAWHNGTLTRMRCRKIRHRLKRVRDIQDYDWRQRWELSFLVDEYGLGFCLQMIHQVREALSHD